jgi:hypothetical protein
MKFSGSCGVTSVPCTGTCYVILRLMVVLLVNFKSNHCQVILVRIHQCVYLMVKAGHYIRPLLTSGGIVVHIFFQNSWACIRALI